MKIGKIENNIPIPLFNHSKYSFLFDMQIGQSILVKLEKKENINKLAQKLSEAMNNIKNGLYIHQKKGKFFSNRWVYKNEKPIGIRIWRIK